MLFPFGWRGRSGEGEAWYREATHRLLAFVVAHFTETSQFKSEFSHQADSSFYLVAKGFLRAAFESSDLVVGIRDSIEQILVCERVYELPRCMDVLSVFLIPEVKERVVKMLEVVGRLRQIGMASRHHCEDTGRASPDAALWISPVPFSLTMPRLTERLERYGKIVHIKRRSHPIGVGADALVQFTQPAHATQALEAIINLQALGPNITVKRMSEVTAS